jgi:hypothetical protein
MLFGFEFLAIFETSIIQIEVIKVNRWFLFGFDSFENDAFFIFLDRLNKIQVHNLDQSVSIIVL